MDLTETGPAETGSAAGDASSPAGNRPSRRGFLPTAGLGVLSVAVAGTVAGDAYAARRGVFSSGSGEAYAPWQSWERGAPPVRLVRAAILAAKASGLAATVTLLPTADSTLLARVDLTPARPDRSPLYLAIPHRHTDRGAYRTGSALPAAVIRGMDALVDTTAVRVHWLTTSAQRAAFGLLLVTDPTDIGPRLAAGVTVLVVAAVIPTVTTWWSLVSPATAVLVVGCGLPALRERRGEVP